jgi:hypothetical protein
VQGRRAARDAHDRHRRPGPGLAWPRAPSRCATGGPAIARRCRSPRPVPAC